jgi:RNA polymerase sigma factor (sigma-70 family)
MKQRSDEQLVSDCLQGNQDAWVVLVRRYRHLIYAVIRSYRLSETDAADVFQSVCLELFHSLPRLRDVKALPRWLFTVTGHECLRWQRVERQPQRDASVDVEFLPESGSAGLLNRIERQQMLREAMDELPARCRQMIELLFLSDPPLPYAELASRLSLAVGSIGFIRKRCLNKLKAALEKLGFK